MVPNLNFSLMLAPTSITRSDLVLKVKGEKSLVSTTFIANFGNGREKFLNKKGWVLTSLLRCGESIDNPVSTYLGKNECCLYYRDWSNVPMFGLWDKDYPTDRIVPTEITSLIQNSIYA